VGCALVAAVLDASRTPVIDGAAGAGSAAGAACRRRVGKAEDVRVEDEPGRPAAKGSRLTPIDARQRPRRRGRGPDGDVVVHLTDEVQYVVIGIHAGIVDKDRQAPVVGRGADGFLRGALDAGGKERIDLEPFSVRLRVGGEALRSCVCSAPDQVMASISSSTSVIRSPRPLRLRAS